MGCGLSKIDTEVTRLCRERKDLIKVSRDSFYSLAHAHTEYFQSLENVEHGIRSFVGEALVIRFSSSSLESDGAESNAITFPDSFDGVLDPQNQPEDGDTEPSFLEVPFRFSEQPQILPVPSTYAPNVSSGSFGFQPENAQYFQTDDFHPGFSFPQSANGNFSQSGSFPQFSSEDPFQSGNFESPLNQRPINYSADILASTNHGAREFSIHNIDNLLPDVRFNSYGVFPLNNVMPYHYQTYNHVSSSNSPYSNFSAWDSVNPFNTVQDKFTSSYLQDNYSTSFLNDYTYLKEVREREGIPDLEGEVDDLDMEDFSGEECTESEVNVDKCHICEQAAKTEVYAHQHGEADIKVSDNGECKLEDGIENIYQEAWFGLSGSDRIKPECNEAVAMNEVQIESTQEEKLETVGRQQSFSHIDNVSMPNVPVHNSEHLQEILCEIKDASDTIRIHAGNVTEMLKPYEPSSTLIKGASPKGKLGLELGMFRRQGYRKMMVNSDRLNFENETSRTSPNLSLTLQKLKSWENKLYEEVKGEEKLRKTFEKELLKLKMLDDRGAESCKINASQLSLQKLTPGIDVAISKVEEIAARAFNIRDNELQPQLCEFICRLHELWKFSSESYKKHVQAILKGQANANITCMICDSSLKATENLEAVMLKLGKAFTNWVQCHNEFVLSMRKWLMKCQLQEQKDKKISCSSSCSLPMPTVLAICSNWHDAIKKVRNADVIQAINNFASVLHQLRQSLNEERHQRLRFEYLSNNHDKQMKKYCAENGVNWDQHASLLREADSTFTIQEDSPLGTLYAGLRPIRSKFHEARRKHEQVVKQVQDGFVTSGVLQNGFVLVLEALEKFNGEMLNAYEQVKIPDGGSSH